MIELLDNLDLLTQRHLDPTTLTLGGVAFGAPASDIPRRRIVDATAPVVARRTSGTDMESAYEDGNGRRLTLDEVVDDAVRSQGFLYAADTLTYRIRSGTVVGFAVYGPHLAHFAALTSYEEFRTAFGTPDRVDTDDEPGGGPMAYWHHYSAPRKCARWDAWDNRVSLVNLGDFDV
ncbi:MULTISPECIES: hypothetical protein [unclassified Kitasatospora]|uniref:hypothetical protein n=1 Tax=unclassified Kitasatospora TaxID=2633591 RepID=UPI0033E20460